jgi:hypothetical protein
LINVLSKMKNCICIFYSSNSDAKNKSTNG